MTSLAARAIAALNSFGKNGSPPSPNSSGVMFLCGSLQAAVAKKTGPPTLAYGYIIPEYRKK